MEGIRIISDSAIDLTIDTKEKYQVNTIPFTIKLENIDYIDDIDLEIENFVDDLNNAKGPVSTACPAPGDYLDAYGEEGDVFVVTISSKLSGSYNSAVLAKNIALENNPNRKIHIFDSLSASAGETNVVLELIDQLKEGKSFEEIVEHVEKYIKELTTLVVLESLEVLKKNGRLRKLQGLAATLLNVKLVLKDDEGELIELKKVRGIRNAYRELIKAVGNSGKMLSDKRVVLSHVRNENQALKIKDELVEKYNIKKFIILQTGGLSSTYASDKGIVLSF